MDEVAVKRGRTVPYSKRGRKSIVAVTCPETHRRRRRTEARLTTAVGCSGSKGATGMQSVNSKTPSAVSKLLCKTLVEGR